MAMLRGERSGSERSRNANAVDDRLSETPKGSFPKSAHLLKHSDFQSVYQQGRRHFSGNMTVFFLRVQNLHAQTRPDPIRCDQTEAAPGPDLAGTVAKPCAPKTGRVRVGFTVSKALGGAVERNRMRRRTREAVRHHLAGLQEALQEVLRETGDRVDVVINPKKSLLVAEFGQISQEIERAFRVIRQHCQSPGQSTDKAGNPKAAERKGGRREARRR